MLGVDWGRRDFLRRAGGALLGLLTLQGLGAPLRSGTARPPIPSPSGQPSRRRVQRGEPMYEALFRQTQAQFRPERWNGEPDWNEVWQYVFVFKSSSVVHSPSQEHAEKGYEQQVLVVPILPIAESYRFLTAPIWDGEIFALYVVEIDFESPSSLTAHIGLYNPAGRLLSYIQIQSKYSEISLPEVVSVQSQCCDLWYQCWGWTVIAASLSACCEFGGAPCCPLAVYAWANAAGYCVSAAICGPPVGC